MESQTKLKNLSRIGQKNPRLARHQYNDTSIRVQVNQGYSILTFMKFDLFNVPKFGILFYMLAIVFARYLIYRIYDTKRSIWR